MRCECEWLSLSWSVDKRVSKNGMRKKDDEDKSGKEEDRLIIYRLFFFVILVRVKHANFPLIVIQLPVFLCGFSIVTFDLVFLFACSKLPTATHYYHHFFWYCNATKQNPFKSIIILSNCNYIWSERKQLLFHE